MLNKCLIEIKACLATSNKEAKWIAHVLCEIVSERHWIRMLDYCRQVRKPFYCFKTTTITFSSSVTYLIYFNVFIFTTVSSCFFLLCHSHWEAKKKCHSPTHPILSHCPAWNKTLLEPKKDHNCHPSTLTISTIMGTW